MKNIALLLIPTLAWLTVPPVFAQEALPAASHEEIPLELWIHDPVISSVNLTADGNRLAAVTLPAIGQPPEISVWDTADLSKPPKRFKPEKVKVWRVNWISNDHLLVIGRQTFDIRVGGGGTRWFRDRAYVVDVNKVKDNGKNPPFKTILGNKNVINVGIENGLPLDPDKLLLSVTNFEFATDIYELNLKNFIAKRTYRGSPGEQPITDYKGDVRGTLSVAGDDETTRLEYEYKHPETGKFEQHHALYAAKREGMGPVGFATDGRTVYMGDNTGRDKNVIREYDLINRQLSEPIFGGDSFEALDVMQSRDRDTFGELIGFVGQSDAVFREYTDEKWKQIQSRLNAVLPEDQTHTVTSRSDDYSIMVVSSRGPKEPGVFRLLINGSQLVELPHTMPALKPELLADMKLVTYEARDGLDIPALLTLPKKGKPPYPTIINPHGGPWARDNRSWDAWVQFLANRGYAVLQPQYRGSQGWGQKLWRAGDNEWGQKMQDDKDDGARWLVEQGIADPDRMAMFGYSYGGFAAMAAAVRPNSPYQCAIAGAGVAELRTFDKITFEGAFIKEFQNPTIGGMSPYDHVKNAEIPILVFHGDRDQRVPIEQSRKYVKALEKAGKDVEYFEIPNLWHSNPWWPEHKRMMLSNIEDYLENRCGPGGI